MADVEIVSKLYQQYMNGLRISQISHFSASRSFMRRNRLLGGGAILISTAVGSSLFATLNSSPSWSWRVIVGVASIVAAVLAALGTFLRYEQLSDQHHSCAVKYGALRRQLETLVGTAADLQGISDSVTSIVTKWSEVDETAPPIPGLIHRRTLKKVLSQPSVNITKSA
jgi:MFS family permease